MKSSLLKYFMLATTLVASISLSAQTYIINDGGSYEVMTGGSASRTKTFSIANPRPCDQLTFNNSQSGWAGGGVKVKATYFDGSSEEIASGKKDGSHTVSLNRKIVKQLDFWGTGTLKKTISNIKLTMSSYADAPTATSWNPTAVIGSADETASTTMEWCNTSAFTLSLSGDGASQFTYSISNNASAGNYGTATITATYKHNVAGTHKATLTITTAFGSHKIELTGTTNKKAQTITWDNNLAGSDIVLPIGKKITSPATAKSNITYEIKDPTVVSIENNTLTALKNGSTTITATAVEDNEWLSTTSTITVKVTEKKVQSILWSDNLTGFKVGDDPFTLTATASVLVDAEKDVTEAAPERNQYISYQSANLAVVSVDGNTLYIQGEGETTLTATLQGDDFYEAATLSMAVRVRVPSTTCESYVLEAPEEFSIEYSLLGQDRIYEPAAFSGPAHILTFDARKQKDAAVGNIQIQQYVNGNWQDIDDANPGTDWRAYRYELDRKATKIRFYNGYGSYKRYFKNVLVSQATYLETTAQPITVEKSIIGDEITRTIAIQYSNIPAGVIISNNAPEVVLSDYELGNDCGKHGEKQITVTVRPTSLKTIEDVITIHDEATGTKLEIPVTVHVQRNTQTITWEQDLNVLNTTDDIILNATAQTEVYYTSSDSTIAYAEGNQLIINKSGQFTLTAVAVESEKYEQATATKNVTVNIVDPTITMLPTVDAITYGATFEGATLLGGEANVLGAWQWNDDLNQVLDAGMHNLKVQFVPSNTAWYSVVDTTISVTVNKAAAILATDPIAVTDLVYNATAQTLIVAGVAAGGTMQYSLDGASYTSDLPTAISAGTYTVYYKVVADANHTDVEVATLTATIAQATLTITAEDYNILYGEAAPTYTATYTGWQGSDDAAVLAGTLAYSCDYVAGNNVGTYTITPSGVTAANYAIQFVAGTLTVNQVAAAVVTAPIAVTDLVYNATAQTLIVAGFAEGGTMQYSLDGESYTSDLPTAISAGTYTVYYKVVADANHTDVEVATLTATIAQAPLTITAEDYNILYGEAAPIYTATYTGWQGSDDAAVLAGTLAYSCDYVAGNNVGTYTITPSGVTAANYAIQFVAGTLTVNQVAAAVATAPIAVTDLVYNATAQTLIVAGFAEGGTMQYSLDGESYTSDLPTAISAGTYTVYYKVVADANHTDVEVATLTATIAQAPLTITAEDYNILYGEAAPTYTATYTGWQGSDDAAVLAGTLAYSCDYVAGNNVGTYTITPSGVTAANYAIQFVAGTLTVNQVAAAVATAPIAVTELVYNATAQTLIVAGVAEGGTMQYSLDGASYTSDLPTAISAGTYTVYYKVVADANHTDVEVATLTATIAQAPLTITAEDYNILYGEAAPTYTATYAGWQGSDDAAVLAGTLAYSCDYVAGNNVGTYTITPSGVTAANYAIQFVAGTLTVNQVAAAVATAPIAITDLVYNATAQTLIVAGVAEGGTMQYSLDGESYTSDLPTAISAGTYTVYYKVVADANHTDVEVATLTATIAQAPQFIEWELTNFVMEVGDTLHLTATATSGLEVTYAIDDDTYAEINGNLLTALQVGTFTITASQDGVDGEYANYLAAESIIETITIVAKNVNTNTEMIFNESKATKIIRDGCLYIIRNNRTYNANGQVVE